MTTIRTIQFNRTTAGLIAARNGLVDALRTALQGRGSPLTATTIFSDGLTPLMNVASDVQRSTAPEDDVLGDGEEPGTLEILAESESGVFHVSDVLDEASTVIQLVGEIMQNATQRAAESDRKNKGYAGRLLITRETAAELQDPSDTFVVLGDDFFSDVRKVDALIRFVADRYESGERDPEIVSFASSVLGLIDSAEVAAVQITGFRDSASALPKLSKSLTRSARQLVAGAGRFLEGIGVMSEWRELVEPIASESAA